MASLSHNNLFELKVVTVKSALIDKPQAERVSFKVVKGEPSIDNVRQVIVNVSKSPFDIHYYSDRKEGSFVDLNYNFNKNQIIS
jgi:hypothetical protein